MKSRDQLSPPIRAHHALGGEVGDDAGEDGQDAVPEGRHREGDPDPLGGEAVTLGVLVHIPQH